MMAVGSNITLHDTNITIVKYCAYRIEKQEVITTNISNIAFVISLLIVFFVVEITIHLFYFSRVI